MKADSLFGTYALTGAVVIFLLAWIAILPQPKTRGIAAGIVTLGIFANGYSARFEGAGTIRPEVLIALLAILFLLTIRDPSSHAIARSGHAQQLAAESDSSISITVWFAWAWIGSVTFSSVMFAPESLRSIWVTGQMAASVLLYTVVVRLPEEYRIALVRSGTLILGGISTISIASWAVYESGWLVHSQLLGVAKDGRLIGLALEVNVFSAQAVCWLMLMYCTREYLNKRIYVLSSLTITIAAVLGATRAAWIALLLATVFFIIIGRGRLVRKWSIAGLALALSAAAIVTAEQGVKDKSSFAWRLENLLNSDSGTGAYRLDIYRAAIGDMSNSVARIVFGSGANSFSQFHLVDPTNTGSAYLSSIWLAVPYDAGMLGTCFLLIFFCTRVFSSGDRLGGGLVVVTVLICSSTTNIIWLGFTWLVLGLIPIRRTKQDLSPIESMAPRGLDQRKGYRLRDVG